MADGEEEDDYLSMTFEDVPKTKESSIQRTARLKREAAERGKIASKAERQAAAQEKFETALSTEMDSSSKGAKMMAKMGFKGGALGKTEGARTRPIEIQVKDDRGGIGMESEKKRKFREAAEALDVQEKKVKLDENEYRERNRLEVLQKKQEGQTRAAMKTLEGFDTEDQVTEPSEKKNESEDDAAQPRKTTTRKSPPLQSINLLWRPLARERLEHERERRMRHDLQQSLSRRSDYTEEDNDDKLAFGTEVEEDLDEEDPDLEAFEALPVSEKLDKILKHLRDKYNYCFWCKYRYPDEDMDGCPGSTEDEHG